MSETLDQKRLRKAVEVGAWKLEDKKRLRIVTSTELHAQIFRLIAMVSDNGKRTTTTMTDLVSADSNSGRYNMFTVKSHKTERLDQTFRYNEVDIRFNQGVRIAGYALKLTSIFHTEDFNPLERTELVGGRKIRAWGSQGIIGYTRVAELHPDAPSYETIDEFIPDLEVLCPATDEGIVGKLATNFVRVSTEQLSV